MKADWFKKNTETAYYGEIPKWLKGTVLKIVRGCKSR